MIYYIRRFFHVVIIANLLFFFSGCGYKSAPIYQNKDKSRQYLSKNSINKEEKHIANI